jgi:RNA polymerase sigma factor (sigma-70 family)
MSSSILAAGIRQLRNKLAQQCCPEQSDEQLLHTFTNHRDGSAFATLMRRHGSMVLSVCRRVLGHEQDAEDAFQATFLVLARNAATLRIRTTLAGFLHGTAYRTAMKAKRSAARRRKHEGQALSRPTADPADELSWREVRTLLDEEIARLPEIYRSVFVLCCLENLSQAEAGRHLGLRQRTVSRRLAAARKRLARRLAHRGVELTAVLAATALAATTVPAAPPLLVATTIKAGLSMAAGEGPAGLVSASVAALVENSSSILSFGKAKLVLMLMAMSLLGSGGALVHFQLAAAERDAPPAEQAKPQPSAVPAVKDKENAVYAGRVLGPDGQPVAGAKLYLLYYTPKELPIPVRATSDKDGRFRFSAARKEFDQTHSVRPWDEAVLVATAKDYGIGLPNFQRDKRILPTDWELRLCKDDVPITGRILDLQGKPVAGVSVSVHGIFWSPKEDLTTFLADLKEKKEGYPALRDNLSSLEGTWIGRDVGKTFPPVVTGEDGRYTLRGVGRERIVALRLQGEKIAAFELFAMTRPGDTYKVAQWRRGQLGGEMTFCGSPSEHIAAPGQSIIGVVRDKDTGQPLPGAIVRGHAVAAGTRLRIVGQTHLRAVADKEGRYQLDGMPRGEGNEIQAEGPDGQPYLMSVVEVPKSFALEPVTVDFQLKRGVWIHGNVTEKASGKPVQCGISCAVHDENPFRREARGLRFEHNMVTNADGSFCFAGLPGRSVVAASSSDPRYVIRVGADRIKDLPRFNFFQHFNAIVEINPGKDAKEVRCDITLESGRTLSGKVVDPEGRPLTGVKAAGLGQTGSWEHESLPTAAFTVLALQSGETRLLQFAHAEKHLAGSLAIRGDVKGPLTVTLKPAGTLKGRFITRDGKPLGDLEFYADIYRPVADPRMTLTADVTFGTFPRRLRTGKDGTFRVEDLAPGLKYRFMLHKGMYVLRPDGPAGTGVTVGEGETKDLGDVTVKLME